MYKKPTTLENIYNNPLILKEYANKLNVWLSLCTARAPGV